MAELVLERLNELRFIRFPFVEDALISPMGTDVLLDLQAIVYSQGVGQLYLSTLAVAADESYAVATFTYVPLIGSDILIPVTVPASAAAWTLLDYYRAEVLTADMSLYPIFGSGIVDFAVGRGGTTVSFTDLRIEPSCLCLRNRHVVTAMDSATDVLLTGDVKIMPGYNMLITVIGSSNTIRLSALVGEGAGIPCEQLLEVPRNCGDLVYRLNGQTPDWYGDLILQGGPGISIKGDAANNKLVIKTPFKACSPGCGE